MLHKLYSLYNSVMDAINRYYETLWVDVRIDKIMVELAEFQNK